MTAQDIKRSFGYRRVLNGVNLAVRTGEHLVILGRNGCGKTTLLNIMATLLSPTSGSMVINGLDVKKQPLAIRRLIGFVTHNSMLYNSLSIIENLRFYAHIYETTDSAKRIAELVSQLELSAWQNRRISELSRGIQQKAAIARALIHRPSVLLLDEPESGLDPVALSVLEKILAEQTALNCTIISTSHNLDFALRTSERIAILDKGRITFESKTAVIDSSSLKAVLNQSLGIKHETVA